jgi:patatin-like phospholipase/acyl hydrolase
LRVLSIDGGGIRGLIPAVVLAEIEERTGKRIWELFDFVAGTSTGGLLACALTRPDPLPAAELVDLYVSEGPRIFHRGLLKRLFSAGGLVDERYEDDGLNGALRKWLGDARLSEALCPIFVTAYDVSGRFAFFFRSARARKDPTYDFTMFDCARATAAAPTYFEPVEVTDVAGERTYPLIDGGVYAVNPAMCAYAELRGEVSLMLSLGTGSQTRSYAYADARWWGQLQWARPAIDMVFDGVADTTEFELGTLLGEERYVRLQVDLMRASDDMDDASAANLAALRAEGEALVEARSADIERVCARLVA